MKQNSWGFSNYCINVDIDLQLVNVKLLLICVWGVCKEASICIKLSWQAWFLPILSINGSHVRSCRSDPGCVCVVDLVLQGNGLQVRRYSVQKLTVHRNLNGRHLCWSKHVIRMTRLCKQMFQTHLQMPPGTICLGEVKTTRSWPPLLRLSFSLCAFALIVSYRCRWLHAAGNLKSCVIQRHRYCTISTTQPDALQLRHQSSATF